MVHEQVLHPVGFADVRFVLGFLGAHAVPGVETWDGTTYARSLSLTTGPAVVQISAGPDGALTVRAQGPGSVDDELVPVVRHLTGLDDDSAVAESAFAGDRLLGPLVAVRPGLRVPGSPDHAETLVRTVVGQQVSVAGARTTTGRLAELAGAPLPDDLRRAVPGVVRLFPTPVALSGLDPAVLPMPRARARCVVAVGAALTADPALIGDDEGLLALPGVGPWTVAYTRLRTKRDPDLFLPTDLAVRRQFEAFGRPGDPASVTSFSERWAPHRSTALMHLWAQYLSTRRAA